MGEKKTTPVTINGNNYVLEDLTQEQQMMFQHCVDLERKIGNTTFQLDQLNVGRNAFLKMLEDSLAASKEQVEAEPVETEK
jgi:hypothetical protein